MIALQCATEDDAKAIVDKLDEAQVKGFVKEFRADVDKEVSDGNKTFENNLKKKFDLVAKKTEPNPGGDGDDPTKGTTEAMIAAAICLTLNPKGEVGTTTIPCDYEIEYPYSDFDTNFFDKVITYIANNL